MADFIDAFDHEHSSPRTVLFRRKTRRHRSRGAQYPLRHPTACGERADCEAGRVVSHQAVSATTIRAFAFGAGTIRVYQAVFRQHRVRGCKAASEQVAALTHSCTVDRAPRLHNGAAAEASDYISRVAPLSARIRAR